MRLRAQEALPDHWRRAVRLGGATALLGALGFTLASHPHYEHGPVVMITKWALITLPVVTMPLLGKTSQVGAERVLGTLLGGILGFLASALSTNWWTLQANEVDDLFLAAAAAAASFLSVLAGKRLNLDLSARLFVIAFIIVSFNAQQGKDPFLVAVTRVCGIALGVTTMLLASVLILPKSASVESLRTLRKALLKLQEINALAWGPQLPPAPPPLLAQPWCQLQNGMLPPPAAAIKAGPAVGRGRALAAGDDSALQQPLLDVEAERDGEGEGERDVEAGRPSPEAAGGAANGAGAAFVAAAGAAAGAACAAVPAVPAVLTEEEHDALLRKSEKALTQLYALLDDLEEQLGLAKKEVWVASCGGHPFLLPGMPFWSSNSSHLPWTQLEAAADAVRRVARLLNTALYALEDGFVEQLQEVLGPLYPFDLLPRLAMGADATIQELCIAFPFAAAAGSSGLAAFSASVAALKHVSDQQRREVVQALRRYRNRSVVRSTWAVAIEAALQQQQQQQGTLAQPAGQAPPAPAAAAAAAAVGAVAGRAGAPPAVNGDTPSGGTAAAATEGEAVPTQAVLAQAVPTQAVPTQASNQQGGEEAAGGASTNGGSVGAVPAAGAGAAAGPSPSAAAPQPASMLRGSSSSSSGGGVGGGGSSGAQPGSAALLLPQAQAQAWQDRAPGSIPPTLFPETAEGHLAQAAWYSFQFLCEELEEQLAALHDAVDAVLARLPE